MENYLKYLDPQTLASLEGLDLQARMVVEGYVAGMHPSPYQGFSVEFAEHREYVAGRRHPARRLEGLVEDRQAVPQAVRGGDQPPALPAAGHQRVDGLRLGVRTSRSCDYARFVVASLAYMTLQQQDSVGLVVFDDAARRYLKPAGQASHLKELLHMLDVTPAREKSDMGIVFHDLAERFKKRGVVAVFSDLFDEPARILAGPEALPAPPPRGDRLPHPRPRRARVPVPIGHALQGPGGDARDPDRAPRPADGPIRRSWAPSCPS